MNRHRAMTLLKDRLDDACLAADWEAVAAADRDIAAALPVWQAAGHWSSLEQVAFARLRQSHRAAFEFCTRTSDAMAVRLNDMNNHKDGWLAYAASGTSEDLLA